MSESPQDLYDRAVSNAKRLWSKGKMSDKEYRDVRAEAERRLAERMAGALNG